MAPANPSPDDLRRELHEAAEPERVTTLQRYFKTGPGGYGEGDVFIGVRVPVVRAVVRRFDGLEITDVADLLPSKVHEERLAALLCLVRRYDRGDEPTRERVYDLYLQHTAYVNNWDLVDTSAPQIVGRHLLDRPRDVLDRFARSSSVWERRISIMATLAFIRDGDFGDTLRIARTLMRDEHDLIHKAVGWMLREVGNRDEAPLIGFLDRYSPEMPRTMLRYAIEKLDPQTRARLMQRTV
ncbi:MAG: DNA alkylation repair protein [Rubrobacteraceae bacterium]